MGEAIGMSTEELFNDEDLDYTPTSAALINKQPVGKIFVWLFARNNTGFASCCLYSCIFLSKILCLILLSA
jgi:hypothetical protein